MRRPYQILLPLLSLFLVRVDLTDLWNLREEVELVRLLDGDTAEVSLGKRRLRVRFAKLDAPEKGQPFLNGKGDAGGEALSCALRVFSKKKYVLRIFGQDIYRRTLGELEGMSLKLVEEGCASLYPHAVFASRSEKWTYLRALQKSKRERKGLWKGAGFRQPKLWRRDQRRGRSRRMKN